MNSTGGWDFVDLSDLLFCSEGTLSAVLRESLYGQPIWLWQSAESSRGLAIEPRGTLLHLNFASRSLSKNPQTERRQTVKEKRLHHYPRPQRLL